MRLIFACGGTGGHIFPAVSVAEEILRRRPDAEIVYVCGKKDIENEIFKVVAAQRVVPITSAPYRGRVSAVDLRFYRSLIVGFREAAALIRRERPQAVVGFGGYVSFPVLAAASMHGINCLIHEQNVMPGRANRWLSRLVGGIALSYEESKKHFLHVRSVRVTGNPIRSAIEKDQRGEALDYFHFSQNKKTLLVLGGSQGAESINTQFLASLERLSPGTRAKMQVLHLCGKMRPSEAESAARTQGVDSKAFSFFDRMDLAYSACDVALGRAGATFLAEISAKRLPAILVPYPYAGGHQRLNAAAYARDREAIVIDQSRLTPEYLAQTIEKLLNRVENMGRRDTLETGGAGNARNLLADFILEQAGA